MVSIQPHGAKQVSYSLTAYDSINKDRTTLIYKINGDWLHNQCRLLQHILYQAPSQHLVGSRDFSVTVPDDLPVVYLRDNTAPISDGDSNMLKQSLLWALKLGIIAGR